MTTITIERAVIHRALSALEYHTQQTRPIHNTELVIEELKSALSAPATAPEQMPSERNCVCDPCVHLDGYSGGAAKEGLYGALWVVVEGVRKKYVLADQVSEPKAMPVPATTPEQKRPINCGTGHCSCIECVMPDGPLYQPATATEKCWCDEHGIGEPGFLAGTVRHGTTNRQQLRQSSAGVERAARSLKPTTEWWCARTAGTSGAQRLPTTETPALEAMNRDSRGAAIQRFQQLRQSSQLGMTLRLVRGCGCVMKVEKTHTVSRHIASLGRSIRCCLAKANAGSAPSRRISHDKTSMEKRPTSACRLVECFQMQTTKHLAMVEWLLLERIRFRTRNTKRSGSYRSEAEWWSACAYRMERLLARERTGAED